jgi:glycerophosphoryl diester phosphodiesterase
MQPPRIFAHRLGGAYGPESSASGLACSLEAPIDGIEADIVLSGDERVVVLHDPCLPLSTDLTGWAHRRTADELCRGRLRAGDGSASDEHPLTLRDLVDRVPSHVTLQLDVKAYADTELARATAMAAAEDLHRAGRAGRDEIISFFAAACLVSVSRDIATRVALWGGDHAPEHLARWARRHGLVGVSLEGFILSPGFVAALRNEGLTLSVGNVIDRTQLDVLLTFQPEIVVTDRPRELLTDLHENPPSR